MAVNRTWFTEYHQPENAAGYEPAASPAQTAPTARKSLHPLSRLKGWDVCFQYLYSFRWPSAASWRRPRRARWMTVDQWDRSRDLALASIMDPWSTQQSGNLTSLWWNRDVKAFRLPHPYWFKKKDQWLSPLISEIAPIQGTGSTWY